MAYFEMSDYCVNFLGFDGKPFQLVKGILADNKAVEKKYETHLPDVIEMAELQFEYLIAELT